VLFQIHHQLRYRYERPVFLEPHTLRLTPRQERGQQLRRHQLQIEAAASGRTAVLEPEGGEAEVLWFNEPRQELTITVDSLVETRRCNPFDWILTEPALERLPLRYSPELARALQPCLAGPIDPLVADWARQRAAEVERRSTALLMHLADRIHHEFHHVGRPDGAPLAAAETLRSRTGACRDTAVLYVEACRSLGLAARFVSGYSMHHPPEVSEHELHAWAEVYIPGGGWRAYDPSLGLAVADGHVALTAAADPRFAAPLSGTYRGTAVASSMEYTVRLRAAASLADLEANPSGAAAEPESPGPSGSP
jgi:transglutaminase-like putative cysteine protease